jgi:hypothetical protein
LCRSWWRSPKKAGDRDNDRTGPANSQAHLKSRTRAHRERLRRGVRLVQVRIKKAEIEALERLGYLEHGLREDAGSIQRAVEALVSDTPYM